MAKERQCFCCMKKYRFCPHCKEDQDMPAWHFLFHDENCKKVYDIWQAYRGKEISKEEAKRALKKCDLSKIIDSGSPVTPELKEILDIHEEVTESKEPVESVEVAAEPEKVEEAVVTEQVDEKPAEEKQIQKKVSKETNKKK